jgi:hypothetical protein
MRVIVHHGANARPMLIDRAMDRAFAVHGAPALINRIAVEIELHDVVRNDKFRAAGPRHNEPVRTLRMPHADMAVAVNHSFPRQNTIGYHQVFKLFLQCCDHASTLSLPLLAWFPQEPRASVGQRNSDTYLSPTYR